MARKINQVQVSVREWHPFCQLQIGAKTDIDDLAPGDLFALDSRFDSPAELAAAQAKYGDDKIPTREKKVYFKVSKSKFREWLHLEMYSEIFPVKNRISSVQETRGGDRFLVHYVYPVTIASVRTPNMPPEAIELIERCMYGSGGENDDEQLIKKYCLTPDQKQWLFDQDLSLGDLFNGRYPSDLGTEVEGFYREWNAKLEYKFFHQVT